MEGLPLAQRLNISKDEVKSMAQKVNFMIYVSKENRLKEEHVTKIYDEWVTVAKRLKKGGQMIEEYCAVIPNAWDRETNKKYIGLSNLYDFLMAILGYYDMFFRHALSKDHYQKLMSGVLEIMRD